MVSQIKMKDPTSSQILQPTKHANPTPHLEMLSKYQCKMEYFTTKYAMSY